MAKIGFIVEGDTDKRIVEILAGRLLGDSVHIHAVRLGGKAALPWAYTTAWTLLEEKAYDHVVIVIDADSTIDEEVELRRQQLESMLARHHLGPTEISVCLAVPEIEAWLLSLYVERPETVPAAREALAAREKDRRLSKEAIDRLATELDLVQARRRSPSFRRFCEVLEKQAGGRMQQVPAA